MPRVITYETYGLDFELLGVSSGYINALIGRITYTYKSLIPGDRNGEELYNKIVKIAKYSDGKALSYLKKNSKLMYKNNVPV